jgi:hypothetical protein
MLPATADRVARATSADVNDAIARRAERRIALVADRPGAIARRLRALDREWDVERALQANAATLSVAGLALGRRDPRWRLLSLGVGAFLLQHALRGWCPPLPLLRRLGFRTAAEIARERLALRLLRGDFGPAGLDAGSAEDRARRAFALAG